MRRQAEVNAAVSRSLLGPPHTYQSPFISHAHRRKTGLPYRANAWASAAILASLSPVFTFGYSVPSQEIIGMLPAGIPGNRSGSRSCHA